MFQCKSLWIFAFKHVSVFNDKGECATGFPNGKIPNKVPYFNYSPRLTPPLRSVDSANQNSSNQVSLSLLHKNLTKFLHDIDYFIDSRLLYQFWFSSQA